MLFIEEEDRYSNNTYSDPVVLAHIREVAVEGRSRTPWSDIQMKMPARIEYCVRTVENYQTRCLGGSVDLSVGSEGGMLLNTIFEKVLSFDDIPFTWRRFCELLYDPLRNYSDTMKYLRALHRVINVQMTVRECRSVLQQQPKTQPLLTPISLFFEDNMKASDRKRCREDVEYAKKRIKFDMEENKENDDPLPIRAQIPLDHELGSCRACEALIGGRKQLSNHRRILHERLT